VNPEQAYILAGQWVLPVGAVGLLIAAMFSATASMISSQLNVFAGVLTNDFYRKLFRPQADERHLVLVGRLFTGGIGLLLVVLAILVPRMGGAERVVISLSSLIVGPLMAPTIWGLISKRIDIRALWATAIISAGTGLFFKFLLGNLAEWSKIGFLENLWAWSVGNPQTLDIALGVLVPVTVLGVMQQLLRAPSIGWRRIEDLRAARIQHDKGKAAPVGRDSTPGTVVALALAACGATVLLLIPYNPADKNSLGVFGLSLILVGYSSYRMSRAQY
jgi:Na+/proline symporter